MNHFEYQYITPTFGHAELVSGYAHTVARVFAGERGQRWDMEADDEFLVISFASQQVMQTFMAYWQRLMNEPTPGRAA